MLGDMIRDLESDNENWIKLATDAYVGWACSLDVVSGMRALKNELIKHGVNLEDAARNHKEKFLNKNNV